MLLHAQGRSRTSFILLRRRLPNALQLMLDRPCSRISRHLEFIIEQGHRVNWVSGSLDSGHWVAGSQNVTQFHLWFTLIVPLFTKQRNCEGNCGPGGKKWQPTAGFRTHVTCRPTAKNRDLLRNPTLGSRVWATFLVVTYSAVNL